jgi:DNA-binding NtrC family response regulator
MHVLLVLGDEEEREPLERVLSEEGHEVRSALLDQALDEHLRDRADLVLLDVAADGGMETLRMLRFEDPSATVVAVSGNQQVEEAVEAMQNGAVDYIQLPLSTSRLKLLLQHAAYERRTHAQLSYHRDREARGAELASLVGRCPQMRQVFDTILRLARRTISAGAPTILLQGETGTGKGCIARAIHYNGRRRDGPFVEVNCAAIPLSLLEGELFGHEKGAFTDARLPRVGLIETAQQGTLFLDEVACLPLTAQAKLLTFLEDKRIRRLGSSVDRTLDVQVVASTNRDLAAMAEKGLFRVDLLHRLNVVTIVLPPLRERGEDRVELAETFLHQMAQEYGQPVKRLTRQAVALIERHTWPGNVRELRNTMERVVLLEDDPEVRPDHLHLRRKSITGQLNAFQIQLPEEGVALEELERTVIEHAMRACRGNVSKAARYLKVSRQTLRYRLKKMGWSG